MRKFLAAFLMAMFATMAIAAPLTGAFARNGADDPPGHEHHGRHP